MLPSPCGFRFSIEMKGGDSPTILHMRSPAGSVAAAPFSLLGAASVSVHWTEQQQEKRTKTAPRSLEQPKAVVSLYRVSVISA